MNQRHYLNTSDGMAGYAQRHGAQYDHVTKEWYVDGDVPIELLSLLAKRPNPPKHIVAPRCPLCHSHMVLRMPRSGRDFWGCSKFRRTGCSGVVELDAHLDTLEGPTPKISNYLLNIGKPERLASLEERSEGKPERLASLEERSERLRVEIVRIVLLASETLGGMRRAETWLLSPKIALKGRSPKYLMNSIYGCKRVEQLLRSIHE